MSIHESSVSDSCFRDIDFLNAAATPSPGTFQNEGFPEKANSSRSSSNKDTQNSFPQRPNEETDFSAKSNWLIQNQTVVLNAWFLSNAVYNKNPKKFFDDNFLIEHCLRFIATDVDRECKWFLASDTKTDDVYLAIMGTDITDHNDISTNIEIEMVDSNSGNLENAKFHKGFKTRAEDFPLDLIRSSLDLESGHLILCGHSLGGAVSSILYCELFSSSDIKFKDIINVTFGSPLFANEDLYAQLKQKEKPLQIYNIVDKDDLVPALLSDLKNLDRMISEHVPSGKLLRAFNAFLGVKQWWTGKKSQLKSLVQQRLYFSALASKGNEKLKYKPIGDFFFVSHKGEFEHILASEEIHKILIATNITFSNFKSHEMSNYGDILRHIYNISSCVSFTKDRQKLHPRICGIELESSESQPFLWKITGDNLTPDSVRVFKIKRNTDGETEEISLTDTHSQTKVESFASKETENSGSKGITIQHFSKKFTETDLECELTFTITTVVGTASYKLPKTLEAAPSNRVESNNVVCLRMAFERNLATRQFTNSSKLERELRTLFELTTQTKAEDLEDIFGTGKCSEDKKEKIISEAITSINSRLKLEVQKFESAIKFIQLFRSVFAAGVPFTCNGSVSFGDSDQKHSFWIELGEKSGAEENYWTNLYYIAKRTADKEFATLKTIEIGPLNERESSFCKLLAGFQGNFEQEFGRNQEWKFLDKESIQRLSKAAKISFSLQEIRKNLASEIYIGIVGPRNAGKTLLLNQLCELDDPEETGVDKMTKKLKFYQRDQPLCTNRNLYVVDFPGFSEKSSFFDDFATMNNFLVVVHENPRRMDYPEDCQNITKVFKKTDGFICPINILICFSQSVGKLDQLSCYHNSEVLSQHFCEAINERISSLNGKEKPLVFITDWKLELEKGGEKYTRAKEFGIVGMETIKNELTRLLELDENASLKCAPLDSEVETVT